MGGSPLTGDGGSRALAQEPTKQEPSKQEAFDLREEGHPAYPVDIVDGADTLRTADPELQKKVEALLVGTSFEGDSVMLPQMYVTMGGTTGGERSNFAVLKKNEKVVKGGLPRFFWSIQIGYILECLHATDIVFTAENANVVPDDFMREALLCAERGKEVPPRAREPRVRARTGVRGMAFVRLLMADVCALRRFTADEMKCALDHLAAGHVETLASTKSMALYNTPGAPGYARLLAYIASHSVRLERIAELKRALDDETSPTFKAMPTAEAVNARGRATTATVASMELEPGSRVMYIAALSCSGNSRGAGGIMLRRITAFADAIGAYIIINAVPLDGLCYTFYAGAGFQFVRYNVACLEATDYMCPMMMRAPDATRRVEAATIPMPAMREWGTDNKERFKSLRTLPSSRTSAPPSFGPFADFVRAWDAEEEHQARGLSLANKDGFEHLLHLPRAPSLFRDLPAWGSAETKDKVGPALATRLAVRMGAPAPVPEVETDDEDVVEVVEEDYGARAVPASWQAVAPSEAGKRRREDDHEPFVSAELMRALEVHEAEAPPVKRSRRDVILEEAAVVAAEPRALRIRTSSSVVAVVPTPSQRQEYDSHLLVNLLVAFAANAELVEKALTRLLAQMRGPLSAADLGIVAGVATRHADKAAVIRLAGSVALACLME